MNRRIEIYIQDPAPVMEYGTGAVVCGYRFEDEDGTQGGAHLGGHGDEGRMARRQLIEQVMNLLGAEARPDA